MPVSIKREIVPSNSVEKLMLKLGGDCNLECKHCHCELPTEYRFNTDIIRWIKLSPKIKTINFHGGEPLLFFDQIKELVNLLGDSYRYKLVTNGTLLDLEAIDFFNDHGFDVCISYDGESSGRDDCFLPRWEIVRFLRNLSLSCYTSGTCDVREIQKDVNRLAQRFHLRNINCNGIIHANFVHEVSQANISRTDEDVELYLTSLQEVIEEQLQCYLKDHYQRDKFSLRQGLSKWYVPKANSTYGVACSCSRVMTLTLDGRFLACPYTNDYFGDIYTGFDTSKLESQIPTKCKDCTLFGVCKNTCFKNTTDHECQISKRMYLWFKQLERKYNIDLTTLFDESYV